MRPGRGTRVAGSYRPGRTPPAGRRSRRCDIALNRDFVGRRFRPYRYEISREKVREYALATAHDDPVYTADPSDVPAGDIVAPPTFAAAFTLGRADHMLGDPALGMHANLVHGGQRFTFHQPVRCGRTLECTPWVVDIAQRARLEILTYQIDCVDVADGAKVVDATTMLVLFEEGA